MNAKRNKETVVQSVVRAADLLDIMSAEEDGMALSAIAEAAGLKRNTAHNLLRTLVATRLVERVREPVRYRLGAKVEELALSRLRSTAVSRATMEMRALSEKFPDATIVLCEAMESEIVVSVRIAGGSGGRVTRPRGRSMNPYASASCLAYQAFCSDEQLEEFRRTHPFWERGAGLWKSPEKLEAFLDRVRSAGCVDTLFDGDLLHKAAAPVFQPSGYLSQLIGLSTSTAGLTKSQWKRRVDELKKSADRLSDGASSSVN